MELYSTVNFRGCRDSFPASAGGNRQPVAYLRIQFECEDVRVERIAAGRVEGRRVLECQPIVEAHRRGDRDVQLIVIEVFAVAPECDPGFTPRAKGSRSTFAEVAYSASCGNRRSLPRFSVMLQPHLGTGHSAETRDPRRITMRALQQLIGLLVSSAPVQNLGLAAQCVNILRFGGQNVIVHLHGRGGTTRPGKNCASPVMA